MKPLSVLAIVAFASAAPAMTALAGTTLYIPMGDKNEILIVDAATDQITGKITDLPAIHGLAGTKNGKYLVAGSLAEGNSGGTSAPPKPAAMSGANHKLHHPKSSAKKLGAKSFVSVIRVADGTIIRRIAVPGAVHHVALTPDGQYALVTLPGQGSVSIIDLAKFAVLKTLKTGAAPNYAAVSRDGKRAYVSNAGDDSVSEISTETWTVLRTLRAGKSPEHLVLAANGDMLYVANVGDGTVSAIALKDATTTRRFKIGGSLHGIDLSDDGRVAFVSGRGANKLAAIDLASGKIRSVPLGPSPYHLAAVAGTGKLYVSSAEQPKLWVVDQKTLRINRTIQLQGTGHQLAVVNQ